MSIYAESGVDYDVLDAGKRKAVAAALTSSSFSAARGVVPLDVSRGEPAFVFELGGRHFAQVLECLGTKSSIARAYQEQTGNNCFADIGKDSVAAIVNDIICVGALPLVVNAYFATGSPSWYSSQGRFEALVDGWLAACREAGATWGGGESPGLSGIVVDTEIDIAGSAVGVLPEGKSPIFGESLSAGDEIVLVASTGIHANGASVARKVADSLPDGYATKMPSGADFGAGVLAATALYVGLIDLVLKNDLPITYLSNLTGHGFRKLMRADRSLRYRITDLPTVPEVIDFLIAGVNMSIEEAYGTFNMGAGFAIYCRQGSGADVVALAKESGHEAIIAGVVEEGDKSVVIDPLRITYDAAHLQLR